MNDNYDFRLYVYFLFIIIFIIGCKKSDSPVDNEDIQDDDEIEEVIKTGFSDQYVFYDNDTSLKSKIFYFLIALENTDAKQDIKNSATLKLIKDDYEKIFNEFSWQKYPDMPALGEALLLSQEDILTIQQEFESISNKTSFKNLIQKHIIPSGKYENYLDLEDKYLIRMIWKESIANGVNTVLQQYLIGTRPTYYKIDGLKYQLSSEEYKILVEDLINEIKVEPDTGLFYSKLVNFILGILEINDRNEAVRFEPLTSGANQKAFSYLSSIDWNNYPYSSILLLGDSPNSAGDDINLSQGGKIRIQNAVEAFNAKLAPIIIISGANVYPYQTPYFEAIEMKKWMINNHKIDEEYIIVDPVARHTTTNLRNGSRLIFRYKIPTNKKGIVVTTKSQNDMIETSEFEQRCYRELGYMPVKLSDRISDTRLEFTPLPKSPHTNSSDPLDP